MPPAPPNSAPPNSAPRDPAPRDPAPPDPAPPRNSDLFLSFLATGLVAFGGAIPMLRRLLVEQRRWLTAAEFTELYALCQFLPGPNAVNMTVATGARFGGVLGALSALVGLLAAPMVIVMGLGSAYARYGGLPTVRHAFAGLAAAAAGLVLATACKIAWPLRSDPLGLLVSAVAFVAIALLRLPLLPTMLALVPVGILLQRRRAA